MPTKPLNNWGPAAGKTNRQDATRQNQNDRDSKGSFVTNPWGEGDPNAMGPTMRPVYDATASGPEAGADAHNDHYPKPYPRVQKGVVAGGGKKRGGAGTGDDERPGPAGKWPL